ncbi:MAG: hypothetical protein JW904_02575 [Spirochaetales bacterium]|nr:hypothetical protein [Spirochaetales bacterium]
MGLLTKAGSIRIVFTPGNGLLQRVITLYQTRGNHDDVFSGYEPDSTGRGLLQKSLLIFKSGDFSSIGQISPGRGIDFTDKSDMLARAVAECAKDFSFPYELFVLLKKEINIRQGVLFIHSHIEDVYRPWIYEGVNKALAESMQFTLQDLNKTWDGEAVPFLLSSGHRFIRTGSSSYIFSGYPVCIPLLSENGFSGALVFSSPQCNKNNFPSFIQLCNKAMWEVGHTLYQVRELPILSLSRPGHSYDSAEQAIAQLQSGIGDVGAELNFITFSLKEYFSAVGRKYGTISISRLREDILLFCNSLLLFNGVAIPLREQEILIIVNTSGLFRPELLQFHLTRAIKNYFQGLFDSVENGLLFTVAVYPSEEKSLEQILAEL